MSYGLVVDYIGETSTSFYQRTKEHVIQQLGGNYSILDPDALQRGVRSVVWAGLWRAGTRDQIPSFLARHDELSPITRRYLLAHRLLLAPLACDRRVRQRIEASIAVAVHASEPRLVASGVRYRGRRSDEEPIHVTITSDCEVRGLPSWVAA